ncbi:MAG: 2-aminomuconate deaminase [Luteibacter sp.]|uniref:RidA family protein n=1 Tax=Luteibacter sp. TaxID=1886636 RepID=UPI001383A82B|nr:RidA family protein [Luteibacter sp.]KAF1005064.1 MAG: 2-aminomuconate deaminase [Luteibacter sp.]
MRTFLHAGIAGLLLLSAAAASAGVVRHPNRGNTLPISAAVEVPADASLVFVSGVVPPRISASAPVDSVDAYGDTKTQAQGVFASIERQLKEMGLGMGDVVKMQVFLVGDPRLGGRMDLEGFTAAYRQYFGTSGQPNLPARSSLQAAGLVNPGYLVEVEVTAVRPPPAHH